MHVKRAFAQPTLAGMRSVADRSHAYVVDNLTLDDENTERRVEDVRRLLQAGDPEVGVTTIPTTGKVL